MATLLPFLFILGISQFITIIHSDIVRKELRTKELIHNNIIQLERPVHYNRIDPSRVVQLSWKPRVFLYQGFLSNEECDHLISLKGKNDNSVENAGNLGDVDSGKLTRSSEIISTKDDVVVQRIEERISAWTFLPKVNSKPFQIMKIGDEDEKQKYDYFGNKSVLLSNKHLIATVILYLSDVSHGGQILFPESEQVEDSHRNSKIFSDCETRSDIIRPVKGNALLFFNIHLNASPDKSSSHARCPVVDGELWFATRNFYLKISPEKEILLESNENILLESDKSDCTDEDDNCPQWAAIGECERNPVYMIGSPDYYGTCRKSCNSC